MTWATVGKNGKGVSKGNGISCPTTRVQEGDWMCGACKHHNFAFRTQCQECYHPAPKGKGKGNHVEGKGNGKGNSEHKGKGLGKGYVPGSSPSATQSRNQRRRAQKKQSKEEWAGGKEGKEKDAEINRLKKELAESKKSAKEVGAAAGSEPVTTEEEVTTALYNTTSMQPLMKALGLYLEESKNTSKFLTEPKDKSTGTAEETVAKLLKTDTAAAEAARVAEYYRGMVEEAEKDDNVPKTILEEFKASLAKAEKVTVKKSEDSQVVLDNMKAVRSRLQASETARLQKEAENKIKATERATTRKEALAAFSVAITVRVAEHLAVELDTAGKWELHYTALAARASAEMALVDAQIVSLEAGGNIKKDATMEAEPVPEAEDKEIEAGSQFKDSEILKEMQKQLNAMQEQLASQKQEALAAVNALNVQRGQEMAFLRTSEEVTLESFKATSNSPTEEAKDAMIRTHQVLSQWTTAGAACMFTMKHLDEWAGLKGETRYLLDHLMSNKTKEKSWMAWFPEQPTDDSIVPRQMARMVCLLLTKSRKAWEQSEERNEAIRLEADGIFTALTQDGKRRCVTASTA